MISFERAEEIVNQHIISIGSEIIGFLDSLGRVLAEDVKSDMDMPPFNKTAVDGFACRKEDLSKELIINEVLKAGVVAQRVVGEGECARIMTGAAIPEGADWVFMVEDAIEESGKVKFAGKPGKDNIAKKGEDIKAGEIVLTAGRIIKPQDIAVMATVGATRVEVSRKLKVAVISTGDELVEPDEKPAPSQIRNSNAYQLIAQVIRAGANAVYYGIAIDNEEATLEIVSGAIGECDLVLLTGGVSMGDYDFVTKVFDRAGVKIIFDSIAVQPGKPTTFGVHKDALVFGLPGNPVSSFVQFELMVRPLIQRSMRSAWTPEVIRLPMAVDYTRKRAGRMGWVPVRITEAGIKPVEYHGSAHINALPEADGLIAVPADIILIKKGARMDVRQI
ncbi:MAG TPA: gephyrin-like molybdotransferase Glp [Bacteroidales bacterium]|nr:gephyrin-like molybdotransferase Glp [Bacteroidales bacterium]